MTLAGNLLTVRAGLPTTVVLSATLFRTIAPAPNFTKGADRNGAKQLGVGTNECTLFYIGMSPTFNGPPDTQRHVMQDSESSSIMAVAPITTPIP